MWSDGAANCDDDNSEERVDNVGDDDGGTDYIDNEEDEEEDEEEPILVADVRGRPAGIVIEDLNWRIEKLRLEEANTRRFLKAGPRFLPYEECCKWVQAWGRWQTQDEW
jgi:hypothetical protein